MPLGSTTNTPLLEIKELSKKFGGIVVLEGLSLSLSSQELRCIIGPNGCGKTTLFNVATGALPPDGGSVYIKGEEVTGLPSHEIARRGIVRKFQVPGIYKDLSVVENLEVPLNASASRSAWKILTAKPRHSRMLELLDICGLSSKATVLAGSLSHGEKQWLEIAMLLASDAELILLDEPTAGMSILETEKTAELINRLRHQFNKTVLVIEHDMFFVRLLNCPVMVMMNGSILRVGPYDEIRKDPKVIEAYLGRAG
ncbi:MAG: ATP-binding cassette domain-containing protein [SAR324 cluster bacterium]|nr:ATP-binding cassette domain-containing protein [SAR324 cluster bacterium]